MSRRRQWGLLQALSCLDLRGRRTHSCLAETREGDRLHLRAEW